MTALEVLWRWIYGSFALCLFWREGVAIVSDVTGGRRDLASLGLNQLTITDPVNAAARVATTLSLLLPPVLHVTFWLAPLLLVTWLIISTLGRTAVLQRVDPAMRRSLKTVGLLQMIRVAALGGSFLLWFTLVWWAGQTAVTKPLAVDGQPRLVEYFAIVIVGTLLMFSLWAIVSWAFSLAPLIAMRRGSGALASLRASLVYGPIRLKLVEINLVMGIIKLGLLVLAMVLSACPLPFETVTTPAFLLNWTLGVLLLYLLASDFFHVARLVAYLELWRLYREPQAISEAATF